jgi:hypothetical protein
MKYVGIRTLHRTTAPRRAHSGMSGFAGSWSKFEMLHEYRKSRRKTDQIEVKRGAVLHRPETKNFDNAQIPLATAPLVKLTPRI